MDYSDERWHVCWRTFKYTAGTLQKGSISTSTIKITLRYFSQRHNSDSSLKISQKKKKRSAVSSQPWHKSLLQIYGYS